MKRIRRISIELIRREVNLSVMRPLVAAAEARPGGTAVRGGVEIPKSACLPPECLVCSSPWFVLPTGGGEQSALVQQALVKHGIHSQLSSDGELLICRKSFELQVAVFGVTKSATEEVHLPSNGPSSRGRGDLNV